MPVNIAKKHYLGKDGCRKMNCAQSVINAFKEKYEIEDEAVESFGMYGGGRAPEGLCGALYAAEYILENKLVPGSVSELENYFNEQAGSLKCREIRMAKKLSCVGCVEKSCEFIMKNDGSIVE